MYDLLLGVHEELVKQGSGLRIRRGPAIDVFRELLEEWRVEAVYCNHGYEPAERERDQQLSEFLQAHGIAFRTFKDQVIFEKSEVVKDDGRPYTVFTPYSKRWKESLKTINLEAAPLPTPQNLVQGSPETLPSLSGLGFVYRKTELPDLSRTMQSLIGDYETRREKPAVEGTTRLGPQLRFGGLSIRKLVSQAAVQSPALLNELIWREFFHVILWHYPHTVHQSFRPEYDWIPWRNDEAAFERWCAGRTGYPLVDAGMRQLEATGWMHNRVRMVVAGFLCKHLLIDWRWGEAWFAQHLIDYDQASNVGNWQWAAGSGVDAAPYFRIFNPETQAQRFDPGAIYQKRWVPELGTAEYPAPMIDHREARERCLRVFREGLKRG